MKKISVILTFFLLINTLIYSFNAHELKDISSEHWAYKSIENLSEKGIISLDEEIFDGQKSVNRFEMAYFLSKTLDRIDDEKANRDDLLILEHIVYEFSEELAKFGFNSKNYLDRLVAFETKLEQNRINSEKNKEAIDDLNLRLKTLEEGRNRTGSFLENSGTGYSDKIQYLEDFTLYLESSIDYLSGSNSESDKYKGSYTLGLAFIQDNFELMLESETSDRERKKGELIVKGQLETNLVKDYYLTFHTRDYERYLRSHFNNVIYDNHNSYTYTDGEKRYEYDYFDSYGISLTNENLGFYIEKTRTDYDSVYKDKGTDGVSVNDDFTDAFNFIAQGKFKYFEGLILQNGNNKNMDMELAVKYPLGKVELIGAYSIKQGEDRSVVGMAKEQKENPIYLYDELKIINGEIIFGGNSNLTLGLEIKSEEVTLYNNYYGSFRYQLSDTGNIKYKFEYLDSFEDVHKNHYFLLNINSEKWNTYGAYNLISTNKDYLVSEESTKNTYDKETNYKETLIKMEYKLNDAIKAKAGYLLREYEGVENGQNTISFIQGIYNFSNTIRGYIKYIKNDGIDFHDRRLDIDNDMIDLDFDSRTGVIREAKEGRVELGIEIEF